MKTVSLLIGKRSYKNEKKKKERKEKKKQRSLDIRTMLHPRSNQVTPPPPLKGNKPSTEIFAQAKLSDERTFFLQEGKNNSTEYTKYSRIRALYIITLWRSN